jgi:membrane protease YdiL (CAAX protease family)
MYDQHSKGISYSAGFFMLIAFAVAGIIFASLVSAGIWTTMTGKSIEAMETGMKDPANSDAMKIIQSITAIIGFLVPALITANVMNRQPIKLLGFRPKITARQVILVCAIMLTALAVSTGLSYLNEMIPIDPSWKARFDRLENEYNEQVEAIIGLNSTGEYILALIVMAFLPALCEEALFRGGLQNFLTRSTKMPWLSIIIVSLLFSAAHFSYYGFLPRLFLGIMLGAIFYYSGNLWLSIIAHFINNAIAITIIYAYKLQGKSLKDAFSNNSGSWWGLLVLPLVVMLLIYLQKISRSTRMDQAILPVQNPSGDLFPN